MVVFDEFGGVISLLSCFYDCQEELDGIGAADGVFGFFEVGLEGLEGLLLNQIHPSPIQLLNRLVNFAFCEIGVLELVIEILAPVAEVR